MPAAWYGPCFRLPPATGPLSPEVLVCVLCSLTAQHCTVIFFQTRGGETRAVRRSIVFWIWRGVEFDVQPERVPDDGQQSLCLILHDLTCLPTGVSLNRKSTFLALQVYPIDMSLLTPDILHTHVLVTPIEATSNPQRKKETNKQKKKKRN